MTKEKLKNNIYRAIDSVCIFLNNNDYEEEIFQKYPTLSEKHHIEIIRKITLGHLLKERGKNNYLLKENNVGENEVINEIAKKYLNKNNGKFRFIKKLNNYEAAHLLNGLHETIIHKINIDFKDGIQIKKEDKKSNNRKINGVFYTPPEITKLIAKKTLSPLIKNNKKIKILDPCCGGGAFLISAAEILNKHKEKLKLSEEEIINSLFGVDIDKTSVEVALHSLSLLTNKINIETIKNNIKHGNSLTSNTNLYNGEQDTEIYEFKNNNSFDWEKEFKNIIKDGGFDAVIMNPPYKVLKVNKSEYKNNDDYKKDKKEIEKIKKYFRNSGHYKIANTGMMNLYQLTIERAVQLTNNKGRVGFICPITLLSDKSVSKLRKFILKNNSVETIINFKESEELFDNVNQALTIMIFEKGSKPNKFKLHYKIGKEKQSTNIKPSTLNKLSDNMPVPSLQSLEWNVLKKINKHPKIKEIDNIYNRRGELDISQFKKFISKNGNSKLIRGNHISPYILKWEKESKESFVTDKEKFIEEMGNSVKIKDISEKRLVCQQISNMSQKKRLKFCTVEEGNIISNSCNYIINNHQKLSINYLLGLLNSMLMNWRFNITSSNNHINNYEIDELPILIPKTKEQKNLKRQIENNVKKLRRKYDSRIQRKVDEDVFSLYNVDYEEIKIINNKQQNEQKTII